MDCQKENNQNNCNCSYTPCSRKGMCCECIQYHLKMRELPACCFPDHIEKSYDRSFQTFADLVLSDEI